MYSTQAQDTFLIIGLASGDNVKILPTNPVTVRTMKHTVAKGYINIYQGRGSVFYTVNMTQLQMQE